jgi:YegS/Rv2252/BmrU family lipid kinase
VIDNSTDAVIIGNPNSGRAGDKDYLERHARTLRKGGLKVEVLNTERPDHATALATLAGDRLVIAAGGDGTVNEVVNGLSKEATLGLLPLGTANVMARELGIPLNAEGACERILNGKHTRVDIGVATDASGVERRFTLMAGMGFDANVVNEVTPGLKRYLKMLAFPIAALKVYFKGDLPNLHIIDGDTIHVAQFAIVANGSHYGGELQTAEDASLTNGSFEVVLVERVSTLLRADVFTRILARSPLDKAVKSVRTTEILARAPGSDVPVQIDGEIWGRLPMSFRVEPAAIQIVS